MDWEKISLIVPGRNKINCKNRWLRTQQEKSNKISWTHEEELLLKELVNKDRNMNWEDISTQFNESLP